MSDTAECIIRSPHGVCGRRLTDTPALVCAHHEAALRETLSDIAELWALLPWFDLPGSVQDDGGKHTKRADPPIPLRLDRIALTDPRNGPTVHDSDVPDVPGVLTSWARMVAEERDVVLPDDTNYVLPAVRFLQRHLIWITEQAWVDDLEEEVRGLRRAVARATGETKPSPVGSCPTKNGDGEDCGGPLWPARGGLMAVRCGKCHRDFDEPMLRHLGKMLGLAS